MGNPLFSNQQGRLIFEQKPRSYATRLLLSSWLHLILGFVCLLLVLGQLKPVWYEILIFAFFIGILCGLPIVANYSRFAVYILDVHSTDGQVTFRYLNSDSGETLTIEKQRLKLEDKLHTKPGVFQIADHRVRIFEDEELMLTIHDYQSFTGSFYTEKLVKNLEEAGVRRI